MDQNSSLGNLPQTLHILRETPQARGMHTVIRWSELVWFEKVVMCPPSLSLSPPPSLPLLFKE